MEQEIRMIDVDDLTIDKCNVRGGEWNHDEEFVTDVKQKGIDSNILVRPLPNGKYGIVFGGRRYNAAIDAGKSEVPCKIREMDDIEAMGRSIAEGKYQEDVEAWQIAEKIGEMLKLGADLERIHTETGMHVVTVRDYLLISSLPLEVKELMKKPEKRSKKVKELEKRFAKAPSGVSNRLEYSKAVAIARELMGQSMEKLFETAVFAVSLPRVKAINFIKEVRAYPKLSAEEVYKQFTQVIYKGLRFMVLVPSTITEAFENAMLKRQMKKDDLVVHYVKEGLKREGYL